MAIVAQIVNGDLDVYQRLLARDDAKKLHLYPLKGSINDNWIALAKAALTHGYQPAQLVDAIWGSHWEFSGSEAEYWQDWMGRFEQMSNHEHEGIQRVGAYGLTMATTRHERAKLRERNEAVFGD